MNLFLGDMHIGHKNVLAYDNRPFSTILDHDQEIKRRWNEKVGENDDVYLVSDISWLSAKNTIRYFSELNGRKHLIKGSHDHVLLREPEVRACFTEVRDYKELVTDGIGIVLCSYPILFYNNMYRGWYHFYGGVHSSYQDNIINHVLRQVEDLQKKPVRMVNIGAMKPWMDFTPRTFAELKSQCERNKRRNIA